MISLSLAVCFFVGIHLFVSGTRLRDAIVGRLGENAYLGAFSLASLVGLVWLSLAYANAPQVPLWGPIHAARPAVLVVMGASLLLVVVGLTTPNPTLFGGEGGLTNDAPPRGVLTVTRHPFLWGAALWAISHLVVNGDLASLILFGGFAILTLAGTASIDGKRARRYGEDWARFAARTSSLPFAAIASGRAGLDVAGMGWWRIALAVVVYALVLRFHAAVFGVSPLPV